jgi:acyl transferase domain-containing protein
VVDDDPASGSAASIADPAAMLARGEERRLLDAWVRGAACAWESLYPGQRPPRVRLPTYPFARERYWAPDAIRGLRTPQAARPAPTPAIADEADEADAVPARIAPVVTAAAVATAMESAGTKPVLSELRRVEEVLRETLADVLCMKPADVGLHTTFVDLGMDSVMGVAWLPVIFERLGVSLGPTKIYEYPTIRDLAAFVHAQMPKAEVEAEAGIAPMPEPPASEARTVDDWLQAIYDGTADPADAQDWLAMPDADAAGVAHAQ